MLICEIASVSHFHDTSVDRYGLVVKTLRPSRFTFLTSMRIATLCKHENPDVVWTYNLNDTLGAISARKINKQTDTPLPYPIVIDIVDDGILGKSIPAEVAKNIDAIVFESEELQRKASSVRNIDLVKINTVIPTPGSDSLEKSRKSDNNESVLGYILQGDELTMLKTTLSKLASLESEKQVKLIVSGTGKARYVMPLVNIARANHLDVEWAGEKSDLEVLATKVSGFVPAYCDRFTNTEKYLMSEGLTPVLPEDLDAWLDVKKRRELSLKTKEIYQNNYTSERFSENVKKMLIKLKNF